MAEIDNDKAIAALEQLETEKARRLQAKIDSGEVVSVQTTVVVEASDENTENAVDRHVASLPTLTTDGRPIHYDLLVIVTGVPRGPHLPGQWIPPQIASSERTAHPDEVEPAAGVLLSSHSQPAYIFVTTRQATNDDPGAIAEGLWSVDDGCVVVTDLEGKHTTSRILVKGTDPATLARVLLREREAPKDFQLPIHYPKLGLA